MNARFPHPFLACLLATTAGALAQVQLPTGGTVVAGQATIAQAGSAMTITQASRNAIVNWHSFNLGADASLRLAQTGADAAMLARVTGGDPSQLLGRLQADGKLYLINPKGVIVGQGAVIDTAGFVASTLDVSDADFLRGGALTFKGDSDAGIVNLGTITAREGNVFLFAQTVKNAGTLAAPKGTAGLGAGTEVQLASPDAPGFTIKLNLGATTAKVGVDNSGVVAAAQAQLEAAGGSIYELAVNQSGVVRATGVENRNGRVLLTAGGGTVGVSGDVTARNADGSGGEILVGGDTHGSNASVANATRTVITSTAHLDASGENDAAKAGRVVVWADDATRFLGSLAATGAGGGFAEVSGKHWLDFNPLSPVQLGAPGNLLLDPDALIVSTGATTGTSSSGGNPFVFDATTEPATLNVTTLQAQLASTSVTLDTSTSGGDITINAPVTWSTGNTLRLQAGGSINLNASITGGAASTLALYPGRETTSVLPGELGGVSLNPSATLAASATISVGTLTYGANAASNVAGQTVNTPAATGPLFLDGNISVGTLNVDLSGGAVGVVTNGSNNAIGAFTTSGTGSLVNSYVVNHHGGLDVTLNSATAQGPTLQFITPGTLTLKSGSSLAFSSPATVLLASTGGAFVNQAGASVFGANTRFLIYTSTTSATTKGGLTGTDVFNHPFDANDDYSGDTVSRFFYTAASGSPILTYAADALTRTYGAANPALTYTTTGWVNGVTNDVTGAPSLSTTATQSSGVGSYTISIGAGSLASSNYDFAFVPATLTIQRAPLTITANDKTRRVNLANPAFDATFSGFVLGQDASALGGTLTFSTPATTSSPVGTYAITPAGLTSSNYAITFVPGTLSITANASLLISANSVSRTYGSPNPAFTASFSGFVGSDNASIVSGLQFSTSATQSSGVGAYTITPFGATAAGYDIAYATGTLTINRAPLTISVPNQSRLYGDANALTANFNGLVNGDTAAVVSGLSLTTTATPASSVGTYPITAAGATASNYSITYAPGSLSVTPAPLTVSVANATRRYGDADPAFSYTISGLKNGDTAAGSISVGGLASLATAQSGVGSYGIVGFSSALSPNYSVTTRPGTLTITPRPVTITANDQTRLYGDANPTFTASFSGLAAFDTPAVFGPLSFSTTATAASGVGNWGITFGTVSNPNYTVTPVFGTLRIDPAPLTLGTLASVSRLYGRADPVLTLPSVTGLRNSDTVAGLGLGFTGLPAAKADAGAYSYSVTATNPNYTFTAPIGTFRIDPAPLTVAIGSGGRVYGDANPSRYDLNVSGLAFDDTAASVVGVLNPTNARTDVGTYVLSPTLLNHNYTITSATGGTFVISPRVLTLTAADGTKVYGDANPAFSGTVTGFAAGDSEFNILKNYGFVTAATPTSSVGAYAIHPVAQTTTANYVLQAIDGTLTVTPAPLTVLIADASRVQGQPDPVFGLAGAQGLKNQDTLASLGITLSTSATPLSPVGSYPITGSAGTRDYAVTFEPGTLSVGAPHDDVTHQLDPSRLGTLNGNTTISPNTTIEPNQTVEVQKQGSLTLAKTTDVAYDTAPLTKADFAAYFGSFSADARTSLQASYANLLKGKGVKNSAYESLSAGARALLDAWMNGRLGDDALRARIAAGDADAAAAFSFMLPTLVDITRSKPVDAMTPLDRQVLGRLADLTEKRRSDTIAIAQQKYDAMVKDNARKAELNGLATIMTGPGDFQAIVEGATQEALGKYVGATLGAGLGTTGASAGVLSIPAVLDALFPNVLPTVLSSIASAGPAIAVGNMLILAVRAVQISESVKNEKDFNDLMHAWAPGQQITSIAELKSAAMNQDMKLSTAMLAAELLSTNP